MNMGGFLSKLLKFFSEWFSKKAEKDVVVDADPASNPTTETPPVVPEVVGSDALDLASISQWLGTPVTGAAITATIVRADIKGDMIYTIYRAYNWPSNNKQPKPCDAICHLFYETAGGGVTGGKFDWWSNGGQSTKGLENVITGYHGHKMPLRGTKCWTMISSIDGKQRSNTCAVNWRS